MTMTLAGRQVEITPHCPQSPAIRHHGDLLRKGEGRRQALFYFAPSLRRQTGGMSRLRHRQGIGHDANLALNVRRFQVKPELLEQRSLTHCFRPRSGQRSPVFRPGLRPVGSIPGHFRLLEQRGRLVRWRDNGGSCSSPGPFLFSKFAR